MQSGQLPERLVCYHVEVVDFLTESLMHSPVQREWLG